MSDRFGIDFNKSRELINLSNTKIEKILNNIDEINTDVLLIKNYWLGKASDAYVENISNYHQKFKSDIEKISNFLRTLEENVNNMEAKENKTVNKIAENSFK